jgi:tetratricopeptide (TPR) repeat protein
VVLLLRQAALLDELGQAGVLAQLRGALLVAEPEIAAGALLRTLRFLLLPWPHSALITRTEIRIDPLTIALCAALVALAAWVIARGARGTGLLAAAWIVAFTAPALLVPAEGVVVAAERYAYLPSIGAAILLGALAAAPGAGRGAQRTPRPERAARPEPAVRIGAMAVVTVVFAAASSGRARVWKSDATLSADVVRSSPKAALAHHMRADALMAAGRVDEAILCFERAAGLDPRSAVLLRSLGRARMGARDPARAAEALRRAVELEPDWAAARLDLAVTCAVLGDWTCVRRERVALQPYPDEAAALERFLAGGRP